MPERICRAMISVTGKCHSGIPRVSQGVECMKIRRIREMARHQGRKPGKAEKSSRSGRFSARKEILTALPRSMKARAIKAGACGAQTVSPRPGAASVPEPAAFLK
jgi:hypothetical protein